MWKFLSQFLALTMTGAVAVPAAEIEVRQPAYRFSVEDGKALISDCDGTPMLELGALRIAWGNPQAGNGVSARRNGKNQIAVTYKTENDPEHLVDFSAVYTATPKILKARYRLSAPESMDVGGTQLTVRPVAGTKKGELYKSGLWTRHPHGGVPYEVRDGYFRAFPGKGEFSLWMLVTGHHGWSDTNMQHLSFRPEKEGSRERFAEPCFFLTPKTFSGAAAAAYFHDRPVSVEFGSAKPFHLFETGDVPAKFTVTVTNVTAAKLPGATLTVTARDFDGKLLLNEKLPITAEPYRAQEFAFELPATDRNLFFVEAAARVGGKEVFSRTNVAVLPPFEFRHRAEGIFGIAAFFDVPDRKQVFELMRRLGVYHLRQGDNRIAEQYGMVAFGHGNVSPRISTEDWVKARDKFIDRIVTNRNPAFEFGNEWNMNQKGEERERRARVYAELTADLRRARDRKGADFKIVSQGIVNNDVAFLRLMHKYLQQNGGWDLIDGVGLHLGRGNWTPDNLAGGWNYLGPLRQTKRLLREFGEKPLYITEAYAKTKPNDWWYDSYRQAAENTVLTFALGMAEGVAAIHFYQLHDGVWHDIGGVNEKDGEYHYGLLMRDNSLKPSAMAYAAAAEALDGAKFVKYYEPEKSRVRGMIFDTPRGKLAILYDRTEGYTLSKNSKNFGHPEPWVSSWKVKHDVKFPVSGESITVIDPIGRARTIPAKNGKVTLTLDGAPLMVLGLDIQ